VLRIIFATLLSSFPIPLYYQLMGTLIERLCIQHIE
jgi:hypothetical protein